MAHMLEEVWGNEAGSGISPRCSGTVAGPRRSAIKGPAILHRARGICPHCRLSGQAGGWHIWQDSLWKQLASIMGKPLGAKEGDSPPPTQDPLAAAQAKTRATKLAFPTDFSVWKREGTMREPYPQLTPQPRSSVLATSLRFCPGNNRYLGT